MIHGSEAWLDKLLLVIDPDSRILDGLDKTGGNDYQIRKIQARLLILGLPLSVPRET